MKIIEFETLHGPNIFHHDPVLAMRIDLEDLAETHSADLPGFTNRLVRYLPGLSVHRCSIGLVGGFITRLHRGTYLAHIVEHIALELSRFTDFEVGFGRTISDAPSQVYKVIVRFRSEEGMKELLRIAVDLGRAVIAGDDRFPLPRRLAQARELASDTALGPSTRTVVEAAEKRSIPWMRLDQAGLIQLGLGAQRRLIQATSTDRTSGIAVDIAQDKALTKRILAGAGIRVPAGVTATHFDEALSFLETSRGPVVIKPLDGHQGQGVSLSLRTPDDVREAFLIAQALSKTVLIEEHLGGKDFRILVVDGKMVAAAERTPVHVVGDGIHTIEELIAIENENPLRGPGHTRPLTRIKIDEVSLAYLKRESRSLDQVPRDQEWVGLRETANLSTGGTAKDVTDEVHQQIREICERAALVVGLDVCGVDLICNEISRPLTEQAGGIIEVNAAPGLRMHVNPSEGKGRDVGGAIIRMLYPEPASGRIPIVSVTGTNGKTTVTRLIGHALGRIGKTVGMTTTDGVWIGDDEVARGDYTGPAAARMVMMNPRVHVAVLETARGGIARRGLGYDWSDVGIITNIQADHIGQDGITNVDDLVNIKRLVVERVRPGGTVILNGDDPILVRLAESLELVETGRELIWVSLHPEQVVIRRHTSRGGRSFGLVNGQISEITRQDVKGLFPIAPIPLTISGTASFQIANLLTAFAACRVLGMGAPEIENAFCEFESHRNNSGRANFYLLQNGFAMVDYGHNAGAFKAIGEMVAQWNVDHVTCVMGLPGDRTDEIIQASARIAARAFDRVIIREDSDLRGRRPGETPSLLQEAVMHERPEMECIIVPDETAALQNALGSMSERDLTVIFYDDLAAVKEVLAQHQAKAAVPADCGIGSEVSESVRIVG